MSEVPTLAIRGNAQWRNIIQNIKKTATKLRARWAKSTTKVLKWQRTRRYGKKKEAQEGSKDSQSKLHSTLRDNVTSRKEEEARLSGGEIAEQRIKYPHMLQYGNRERPTNRAIKLMRITHVHREKA